MEISSPAIRNSWIHQSLNSSKDFAEGADHLHLLNLHNVYIGTIPISFIHCVFVCTWSWFSKRQAGSSLHVFNGPDMWGYFCSFEGDAKSWELLDLFG